MDTVPVNEVKFTFNTLKEVKNEKEKTEISENIIAELAGDPRFEEYKKLINFRIEALIAMLEEEKEGDSLETLGFKFLATRIAIKHLKEMTLLPEAILEANKLNGK